jgi:hypothetical protein
MKWQRFGRESARSEGSPAAMFVAAALMGLLLGGCASVPTGAGLTKDSPAEAKRAAVKERVDARWEALMKGDLDRAYLFLSPASREVTTLDAFKTKVKGAGFRAIEVQTIECEAEVCNVRLMLTYDHRLMQGVKTPVEETWVLDQGQAWYVWRM